MDIKTFSGMLKPDKNRLDHELEVQSDVMFRICEKIAALTREHAVLVDQIKGAEFEAFKHAKGEGSSDKHAELQSKSSPMRTAIFRDAAFAKEELERWQGLYEAWKTRGYSLNNLVELYKAQYFTTGPMHGVERPVRRDYSADRETRPRPRRRVT